jgi:hypothetical protein
MARVVLGVRHEEQIMKIRQMIVVALFAGLAFAGLSGCEKNEGPAEEVGKAVDEAASDVAEKASDTMEAIEKKAEE